MFGRATITLGIGTHSSPVYRLPLMYVETDGRRKRVDLAH